MGESDLSSEVNARTLLPAPSGVSATVQANDQIDVSWTDQINNGNYHIQIQRDGGSWVDPSGGSTTVGHNTTSRSYGPNSDNSYASQVGIDSSFQFRVRSETEHTSSGWDYSSTVYTDPISPHNPSVSRPDANTIEISWTDNSDIADKTAGFYRKDTGNGYSSWSYDNSISITSVSKGSSRTVTASVSNDSWVEKDARYQFRLRHEHVSAGRDSEWVYADYGNKGNVYFEDDFESNDLSAWDSVSGSPSVELNDGSNWMGLENGADEGDYSVRFTGDEYIEKNLGDLSNESDVIVRCAFATGNNDDPNEQARIQWYDGSSWTNIYTASWEYNRQDWHEAQVSVSSSLLSTDNRIRFRGFTSGDGNSESGCDRVVVSDILHEYTKPAAPSSLSLDNSTEGEITGTWTRNASFPNTNSQFQEWRFAESGGSLSKTNVEEQTSYTDTGLLDGEKYDVRVDALYEQFRHGSTDGWWRNTSSQLSATTVLPAPTGLSVSNIGPDSADLNWTDNHNCGDTKIQYKKSSESSWNTLSTLSRNTETETLSSLLNGEQYDVRVVANTEHTQTVDS